MSRTSTALPAGTWNIDPSHSRIGFSVKHLGISTVRGEFRSYEASSRSARTDRPRRPAPSPPTPSTRPCPIATGTS